MRPARILLPALALCIFFTPKPAARAQFTVSGVLFKGGAPYTDAELLAVTGVKLGQPLVNSTTGDAVQRLLDTGLFDQATLELDGRGSARRLIISLQPTPASQTAPGQLRQLHLVHPAADRRRRPRARSALPRCRLGRRQPLRLHPGRAPAATRGRPPRRHLLPLHAGANRPASAPRHRVPHRQTVHPALVHPPHRRPASLTGENEAIHRAVNQPYYDGLSGETTSDVLLTPARNAGYIDAALTAPQQTYAYTSQGIDIDYTAALTVGPQFKIAAVTWQPTEIYSAADFNRDNKLHPGDLASLTKLADLKAAVLTAYRAHGYLEASLNTGGAPDSATGTVSYALRAVPGDQYRLKSVTATGLSADAQQDFDRGWLLKAGDPYNESYVTNFLHNNTALRRLNGYSAAFQVSADPQTHLVDLNITFLPMPRGR